MRKTAYFHVELRVGNAYELLQCAYKDEDLQLANGNELKGNEVLDLDGTTKVSMGLIKEVSRAVYGAPISEKSRLTLTDIGDTAGIEFKVLDVNKFTSDKSEERKAVISAIANVLSDEDIKLSETNRYRVVVELEK